MKKLPAAADFARRMTSVATQNALYEALAEICELLDVRYFALSHHVDFTVTPKALRLHNYPNGWQDYYDANCLGLSDPIHRASQRTACAFFWREVGNLIAMNARDLDLLELGREIGLGDGITIPFNVPGEAKGSVSFVAEVGRSLPGDALFWAHAVGARAFEGARKLHRGFSPRNRPPLSMRQRQCIALSAFMSNRRIAARLGISEQTVMEHLREARGRLGLHTRAELAITLIDYGELSFNDCRDWAR